MIAFRCLGFAVAFGANDPDIYLDMRHSKNKAIALSDR